MLYLSIIFILAGIAILIYSMIHESGERYVKPTPQPVDFSSGVIRVKDLQDMNRDTRSRSETCTGTIPVYRVDEKRTTQPLPMQEKGLVDESDDFMKNDSLFENLDRELDKLNLDDVDSGFDDVFGDDSKGKGAEVPDEAAALHEGNSGTPAVEEGELQVTPISQTAALFEDSSTIIDYTRGQARIDPELKEYEKIKRIGSGQLIFENDGISFYAGKKLYRYDFHRLSDLKTGRNFLALMMKGISSVKLLITENQDYIRTIDRHYRDYKGIE